MAAHRKHGLPMFVDIIFFFYLLNPCHSSTHWLVTEDGRIQGQVDSVFQLRRPYDLVAFLQQEERSTLVEKLKKELMEHKNNIDQNEDKEVNLEHKVYTTERTCLDAGKPLTEFDLYVSTTVLTDNRGINSDDLHVDEYLPRGRVERPNCTRILPLDFSMHAFEHLNPIRNRHNLSALPEPTLIEAVSTNDNIEGFGDQVHRGLNQNKTSWIFLNMAAYYWRMVGDATNAVECVRRALHYSPLKWKDVALINLANILHRAQHSDAAAVVANAAADVASPSAMIYFTLGNIYTVLADYNTSMKWFDRALRLEPQFEMAKRHRDAVRCHSKVEKALEAQHNSLQKTLTDLRHYQQRHELWLRQQEKLMSEQAPMDARLEARLEYEEQRLRKNLDALTPGQVGNDCFHYERRGQRFLRCNVHVDASVRPLVDAATLMDLSMDIELMHTVESKAERAEEAVAKQKNLRLKMESAADETRVNLSLPTKRALYADLPPVSDGVWTRSDWPSSEECKNIESGLPALVDLPSLFLPLENKGFEVNKILGKGSNDPSNSQPYCPSVVSDGVSFVDSLSSVIASPISMEPDSTLKDDLLITGPWTSLDEVGRRISNIISNSISPPWLLFNLAAIYWRAVGNAHEAMKCLQASFRSAPSHLTDVPLVNMASLMLKMAALNDAILVTREALQVGLYEPETNFLYGNLMMIQLNLTSAIYHYKMALSHKDTLPNAVDFLQRAMCHLKTDTSCVVSSKNDEFSCKADVEDDSLPDVLSLPKDRLRLPPPSETECRNLRRVDLKKFTSTWLSVSAKGINVEEYLVPASAGDEFEEPECNSALPPSAHTLDHLSGVKQRHLLPYSAELVLKTAFESLGQEGSSPQPLEMMATRIAQSLRQNSTSWVASSLAALYWRVMGNASAAINCLRHSLHWVPRSFKDVPLISLANILHRSRLFNDALIVASWALDLSPHLVVIHFTLANIFAAKGDLTRAQAFYESTLALQSTFDPANARLRSIQCASMSDDDAS